MSWPTIDTGWKIEIRQEAVEPIRVDSRIASLPEAVAEAIRDAMLASARSGSFQITVRHGQLEPAGSASGADDDQPDVYERIGLTAKCPEDDGPYEADHALDSR